MVRAGIVGLAIARELHTRYPSLEMAVLEKDEVPGQHVSGQDDRTLVLGPSGVRARAVGVDGALVDDVELAKSAGSLHVLDTPSPAATASLSTAGVLADGATRLVDLPSSARSSRLTVVPGGGAVARSR